MKLGLRAITRADGDGDKVPDVGTTPLPTATRVSAKTMKHLSHFNGAISRYFASVSIDSRLVLNAVNAWVGEVQPDVEGDENAVVTTTKAKLSGKVTAKADKRVVTITESEKRRAKVAACAQSLLYALNSELDVLTDRHGIALEISELPPEVARWAIRESWLTKSAKAEREEATKEEREARADMEYGTASK